MADGTDITVGDLVEVRIEVPRGSLRKERADGTLDFVAPLPCPVNYGSVCGSLAADGEPLDAVVLGPTLPRGVTVAARVQAVVRFVDAGLDDPKLICARAPLRAWQRVSLSAFFWVYARFKRSLQRVRRTSGRTAFDGWEEP